jgi:hypothetical protein
MQIHPERTWDGIQITKVNWRVYTDKMCYHYQWRFYIVFWVNTSLVHGYQHSEETLSQFFVNRKIVAAVFHWKWNKGSQLSVYIVSLPRELGIGISLHTHGLLRDNYTLPQQTSRTPTLKDYSVESENIFFKAKLRYHISNSTMTKHCCLQIQSSNTWQTTDQNPVTVCFSSKLHSQLGGFKIMLSSVSVHQEPWDSWSCQDFSLYFS